MRSAIDDLVARSAWELRDPQFTHLVVDGLPAVPCMAFLPAELASIWPEVQLSWANAPHHPCLLRPVRFDQDTMLLRYAPLSWRPPVHSSDGERAKTLAHWGVQLAELFEALVNQVPKERLRYLVRPRMWIDIRQQVRVGFLPVSAAAPRVDEDVWISLIAEALRAVDPDPPDAVVAILDRCEESARWRRLKRLRDVRDAFDDVRGNHPLRELLLSEGWLETEEALGWLALQDQVRALVAFKAVKRSVRASPLVDWGIETCTRALYDLRGVVEPAPHAPKETDSDWASNAAWDKRPAGIGPLLLCDGAPAFGLETPDENQWTALCTAWAAIPPHPNILELRERRHDMAVLRYAALDWSSDCVVADDHVGGIVAQLCDAFQHIMRTMPRAHWQLFARPHALLDIGGQVRLTFAPVTDPLPDEPFDERSFVFIVGNTARQLCRAGSAVTVARVALCTDPWPGMRPASLAKVIAVFAAILAPSERIREGTRLRAWSVAEEALGWFQLSNFNEALERFYAANAARSTVFTRWGIRECRVLLGMPPEGASRFGGLARDLAWADTRTQIEKYESERAFKEAMGLYYRLAIKEHERVEVFTAQARCHLSLREPGHAIDAARRALEAEPGRAEARLLLVRALIESKHQRAALDESESLLRDASYNADAHYLRGKALVALGRFEEARDAFDLALALRPTMLEAMLLRREADKSLAKLGKTVGQQQVVLAIPPSLEPLRETLLGGRSKDIIAALSDPGWVDDPDAQLMLARFCSFEAKHDRALEIYDRIGQGPEPHRRSALIGKAGVLLDLSMYESALALFEAVIAEEPNAIDAIEGRARTLDKLGRTGEAAAEFRRFVALGSAGANLHVRVAQLWLDAH